MADYIRWIRERVGHASIILNFAGCVIVDDQNQVLLQQRGDRERDVWGFPGGAVELGETVMRAAVRETLEETGLTVRPTALLGIYSDGLDSYPNGDTAQATVFTAEVTAGELSSDGHETLALQYFGQDALPVLVNDQHRRIAQDFFAGRRGCWD